MKFKITKKPRGSSLELGKVLTIDEAAQLLELNAATMRRRSSMAAAVSCDGVTLEIVPEEGEAGNE